MCGPRRWRGRWGHEIIGHDGLRAVFGEKFDSLLDIVYRDHFEEVQKLSETYNRGTETVEDQRYLTEEFLANCADASIKPSWWKEFIGYIRNQLRKIFPKMHFTDADIEAALSRSARAMRKGMLNRRSRVVNDAGEVRYSLDEFEGRSKLLRLIDQFKEELENIQLDDEQQGIYDVMTRQKDRTVIRVQDLDSLREYVLLKGSRGKGAHKILTVHYAGVRGKVTAEEIVNIGNVIRNGDSKPGDEKHPTSHTYEMTAEDGARLRVVIDYDKKKNESVINFYSNRKGGNRAHQASSGITDSGSNMAQDSEKSSGELEKNSGEEIGQDRPDGGVRYSVAPVWTGSAADYEKPSLHYVGTGEGAQVYGWGLYGSSEREVGEWYANADVNRKNYTSNEEDVPNFTLDGESASGYASKAQLQKICDEIETEEDYFVPREIENVFKSLYDNIIAYDYDIDRGIQETTEEFQERSDAEDAALNWILTNRNRISIEPPLKHLKRNLYKQTFWPGKEENLLDWDEPVKKEQIDQIIEALKKDDRFEAEDYEKAKRERGYYTDPEPDTFTLWIGEGDGRYGKSISRSFLEQSTVAEKELGGGWLYDQFVDLLGSPKAASEFLYRAGIDGITYIGNTSDVRNYVAFSDEDIQVDEHIRFSIGESDERGSSFAEATEDKERKPYYEIPFADGLKRVVDPAQKGNRDPVYVRDTPKVFRDIGFASLPMMANARHLRLNYYTVDEFKAQYGTLHQGEHAHGLHDAIKSLPKALENPLAIVVNQAEHAKPGSVVAITDMDVKGKKIVVPVLIEATSTGDNQFIDSHLVLTVYDESDWMGKFLKPALEAEKNGVGIFYFDEKKASRYNALSNRKGIIPTGLVHTIDDDGSPVKGLFKKNTETLQFKRLFRDSKVVDENGEPLVVYRGAEFDPLAQEPGKGVIRPEAYFTADPEYAKRYARNGGEVREYYLNIRRPFDIRDPECLKDLQRIYPDHEFQRGKSGALDWGEASIVDGEFLKENFGDKYDGIIYDEGGDPTDDGPKHRGISYVPLDGGTQVKSATDNIGTYDGGNPDVRYMLAEYSEGEIRDIVKILKPYVGVFADRAKSDYQKYLTGQGVEISEKDAWNFALEAARQNNAEARQRARKRRDDWIYENNPLWRECVDFCGGTVENGGGNAIVSVKQ